MKCIICGKEFSEENEMCKDCERFIDSTYGDNTYEKEEALERFRKLAEKRREEGLE